MSDNCFGERNRGWEKILGKKGISYSYPGGQDYTKLQLLTEENPNWAHQESSRNPLGSCVQKVKGQGKDDTLTISPSRVEPKAGCRNFHSLRSEEGASNWTFWPSWPLKTCTCLALYRLLLTPSNSWRNLHTVALQPHLTLYYQKQFNSERFYPDIGPNRHPYWCRI